MRRAPHDDVVDAWIAMRRRRARYALLATLAAAAAAFVAAGLVWTFEAATFLTAGLLFFASKLVPVIVGNVRADVEFGSKPPWWTGTAAWLAAWAGIVVAVVVVLPAAQWLDLQRKYASGWRPGYDTDSPYRLVLVAGEPAEAEPDAHQVPVAIEVIGGGGRVPEAAGRTEALFPAGQVPPPGTTDKWHCLFNRRLQTEICLWRAGLRCRPSPFGEGDECTTDPTEVRGPGWELVEPAFPR